MNLSNVIYQMACKNQEVTIEQLAAQADFPTADLQVLSTVLNQSGLSNWLSAEWVRQLFPPVVLESGWVPPQLPPELDGLLQIS
jgi:hypothetical protein